MVAKFRSAEFSLSQRAARRPYPVGYKGNVMTVAANNMAMDLTLASDAFDAKFGVFRRNLETAKGIQTPLRNLVDGTLISNTTPLPQPTPQVREALRPLLEKHGYP